jgi:hypothetical protein
MAGEPLVVTDLDVAVGDLLTNINPRRNDPRDSLEVIEAKLALDEELAGPDLTRLALVQLADESVMKPLLGPASDRCQWDPATVWVRSVRGIINERVRCAGNCACGEAPSNNEMQLTRSAMVNGRCGPCS